MVGGGGGGVPIPFPAHVLPQVPFSVEKRQKSQSLHHTPSAAQHPQLGNGICRVRNSTNGNGRFSLVLAIIYVNDFISISCSFAFSYLTCSALPNRLVYCLMFVYSFLFFRATLLL